MKTYLSYDGYCVKWAWCGNLPNDAHFVSYGKLVNPKGDYSKAETVSVYFSKSKGYGYTL